MNDSAFYKWMLVGFLGICLCFCLVLWSGCSEDEKTTDPENTCKIYVGWQPVNVDECRYMINLYSLACEDPIVLIYWRWADFGWNYMPGSNGSFEFQFPKGDVYLLQTYGVTDKGMETEIFERALRIDCGSSQTEEITLSIDYLTPEEPKCEKVLLRWRGGVGPYDILKNDFPENELPVTGYQYGTISAIGDTWQIVDSSGNESNIETWTAPGTCY